MNGNKEDILRNSVFEGRTPTVALKKGQNCLDELRIYTFPIIMDISQDSHPRCMLLEDSSIWSQVFV